MAEKQTKQHIQIPDPKPKSELKPFDYLVYANIKRFMNKETKESFPSVTTIAKLCDCTEPTVRTAIKRLEKVGEIEIIKRIGCSSIYKFKRLNKDFEMFTKEFLDEQTLSSEEKAYLIGFQSQSYKEDGFAFNSMTNEELSKQLNISSRTIQKYNKSLQNKNIMIELQSKMYDNAGYNKPVRAIDLALICQAVLFVNQRIDEHENRINKLEKMIELLAKENIELKKQLHLNSQLSSTEFEF